ncbi:MAG: REP element-mobilizing transposase RayT [Candidatus Azotimanducaceae bacterium]|jgi:REP element-mobilizing transposase RayT
MTYPRSHLVDPDGGTYHVCSRCVRQTFLCGVDELTGRDFSHRREWIRARIFELSRIFTISIYAYAVMSNHYHIVLGIDRLGLTDEEIADRWLQLCPVACQGERGLTLHAARRLAIINSKARLAELRARLHSLSWFMRFINEPLARLANKEDNCTGRFWEGRFKSQILLDEASVLASMVYVDLNPVRAGIADDLEDSDYTSVQHRLVHDRDESEVVPISGSHSAPPIASISLADYINLVHWTAKAQISMRRSIPSGVDHCLRNNHTTYDSWFRDNLPRPHRWQRAMGSIEALKEHAKALGQCWIKRQSTVT